MPLSQAGRRPPASWTRVAFAMFAVGWGANQFSPMLIVYRHELGLSAGALAGLFGIYAAALIPGLLLGGPASDRFGRRPVVIPFVLLSPVATLLLAAGAHSLAFLSAGRALAGLCSGVVFGAATAWVQELSDGSAASARRSAVALSAGFGSGPLVAALIAQWAPNPLVVPYLPHVAIGAAAVAVVLPAPETGGRAGRWHRWPPGVARSRGFWRAVAPAAPWVFGSVTLAIVVLPEQVTSARGQSVAFAGVITALALGSGVAVQPFARRLEARRRLAANVAGLACAAAAALLAVAAVAATSPVLAIACAPLFGCGYGLCLVSGLRETERLAAPGEHGAAVATYYALTYLGFGFAYLADGLGALAGRLGAFAALAAVAALLAGWAARYRPAAGQDSQAGAPREGARPTRVSPG